MTEPTDYTTILLDIRGRLGAIEAKLEHGQQRFKDSQEDHDAHEARIVRLETFERRVGSYIWLGGSIASFVLVFMIEGLKYAIERWLHL